MTEGEQLLSDGVLVTLSDGDHRLRFVNRALMQLEKLHGTIDKAWNDGFLKREDNLALITEWLALGLWHEHIDEKPVLTAEQMLDRTVDLVVPARLDEYITAIREAFFAALPQSAKRRPAASEGAAPVPPPAETTTDGPGDGSTTLQPSSSTAVTASSGTA